MPRPKSTRTLRPPGLLKKPATESRTASSKASTGGSSEDQKLESIGEGLVGLSLRDSSPAARPDPRSGLGREDDREALLIEAKATSGDWKSLRLASEKLRGDREVVLAMLKHSWRALQFATSELQGDKAVVLEAVRKSGYALLHTSPELLDDKEVVLEAVRKDGCALEFASARLQGNLEVVLAAVQCHGKALEHASTLLRGDRQVVLAAVQRNGIALQHASTKLQGDREVIFAAVQNCGLALKYVKASHPFDRNIALVAVRRSGLVALTTSRLHCVDSNATIWAAAQSKLAHPGEENAPVLRVQLRLGQDGGSSVDCHATFALSGRSLDVQIDLDGGAEEEANVNDLAALLVKERPSDMQAYSRVFLVMEGGPSSKARFARTEEDAGGERRSSGGNKSSANNSNTSNSSSSSESSATKRSTEEGREEVQGAEVEGTTMTPFDWHRPLVEFLEVKRPRRA